MKERIALITGATGGIGKATAMALAKLGYLVVIHGRNKEKTIQVQQEIIAATGNSSIDVLVADMFLLEDVKQMAADFHNKYNRLDVLINNAGGIMSNDRQITTEGHEKTIAVNLLSPFLLTGLLMDILKQSDDGRIINVSSSSHRLNAKPDFNDMQLKQHYNPMNAYGNSKLFLIWITQQMATMLKSEGVNNITANAMHPGAVSTNFGRDSNLGPVLNILAKMARPLMRTVEKGAETLVYLASAESVKRETGKYFVDRKPVATSMKYYTAEREKLVWEYCMHETGMEKYL